MDEEKKPQTHGAKEVLKILLSVILVYTTHYATAKVYDNLCVPDGMTGYLQGFITTASPWCKMSLDIMKATENHYSSVILVGLSRTLLSGIGI